MDNTTARILIVDDDTRNVRLLEAMLLAEGHATITASSGQLAVQFAMIEIPDLILLDVMMPDMNGFEVVEKLKGHAATQDIPIVMITALDDRESRQPGSRYCRCADAPSGSGAIPPLDA